MPISSEYPHGARPSCSRSPTTSWPSRWRRRAACPLSTARSPSRTEAAMVARVKSHKAGFVVSALQPRRRTARWRTSWRSRRRTATRPSPSPRTARRTASLLGIVSSRDYRVSPHGPGSQKVRDVHDAAVKSSSPRRRSTTLKEANDIIWEHKLNSLPIVDADGHLLYFVFRKDYASHKENPLELLDDQKRYLVGAGDQHARLSGAHPGSAGRGRGRAVHRLV